MPASVSRIRAAVSAALRIGLIVVALGTLGACTTSGYYWQAARGHWSLLQAARPVDAWLADPALDARLRERLELALRIRAFASETLALPDNGSYRRYADLGRRAVVWNVVAAPPDTLSLRTWCFPVAGCVGYRGYFDEPAARDFAREVAAEGLEVGVYAVPAYSTLGWLDWLGGDPLLNTFIHYPEGELARLLIHELAHQRLYLRDDTPFNESFATAVERLGGTLWLQRHASAPAREAYTRFDERRRQFRARVREARSALTDLYAGQSDSPAGERATVKARILADLRDGVAALTASWADTPQGQAYRQWAAQANNASIGAFAAYDDFVPGFEALFAREGRDWTRFYDAVERLAALPKAQRHRRLEEISHGPHPHSP
jgi:predicted aminopeptidase